MAPAAKRFDLLLDPASALVKDQSRNCKISPAPGQFERGGGAYPACPSCNETQLIGDVHSFAAPASPSGLEPGKTRKDGLLCNCSAKSYSRAAHADCQLMIRNDVTY
jgi:hypothetical protein